MERPSAYIPMDRRQAMLSGKSLPETVHGSALFTDISGFTPLTETLLNELGPQRGAEELSRFLNEVYDALIAPLHQYGGSVISFSGDAITCWFEGDNGLRATACAFAMQQLMQQFAALETPAGGVVSLAVKTAVASGSAKRFLVGNPDIQVIDALAGSLLDTLANAEKCADKGDIVLSMPTLRNLGDAVTVRTWQIRSDGSRFGIVDTLHVDVPTQPWPDIPLKTLPREQVREWLLPAVYERLASGRGEFLAELRPATALFLRFAGIDYDRDPAARNKLDGLLRHVQNILARYESNVLQLTIGDKGSYLYAAFGAPLAHEDNAIRAVSAALELRELSLKLDYLTDLEIGISQGRMRTGAYGGAMRRTYGVLGDEVNLAARLMQKAQPGHILVSAAVQADTADLFEWERLPDTAVKGKQQITTIYNLKGRQQLQTVRLQEPNYALPMVGRQQEIQTIAEMITAVSQSEGRIIHVSGEAGMGKSRLVAEAIRVATAHQLTGFGGECQSYGTNTSYLVWQRIWQGFFNLNPNDPGAQQLRTLENELRAIDPQLVNRMPLLSAVLKIDIPDNELTQAFDAKLRKTSLEALLLDCIRKRAEETAFFLVLDDCHWIDPLSKDLLEVISRGIADRPILIIVVTRSLQTGVEGDFSFTALPTYAKIHLSEFTPQEAEDLIRLKITGFFGNLDNVPKSFIHNITQRAEGNPFYIEELLNYLESKKIDPRDTQAIAQLDLPTSLHTLILSRIDQLTESQKSTLKVASVIGRLFKAAMLWGVYPQLGDIEAIKLDLEELNRLDLTPLDTPEPELTYLFKNVITQEVAYESLPFAMRSMLHGQIAGFIEQNAGENLSQTLDLLAYHYSYSYNEQKKREYLLKAGEAAQRNYANEAAIEYYQRVMPLLAPSEQISVRLKAGQVLELMGQWDEALQMYRTTIEQSEAQQNLHAKAQGQTATGELYRKRGLYEEATHWLEQARVGFEGLGNEAGIGQVLHFAGSLAAQQGDFETARIRYEASLKIRRRLQERPHIASLLSNLGIVARYQGQYDDAQQLHEEGLEIRRQLGDRRAIAVSLNNLGNVALDLQQLEQARKYLEEAILLQREVGDKSYIANSLNNLGNVVRAQHDYETARGLYTESMEICRELGDKWSLAYLLEDIGCLSLLEGHYAHGLRLLGAATSLRREIGAPRSDAEVQKLDDLLESAQIPLENGTQSDFLGDGAAMSLAEATAYALERP